MQSLVKHDRQVRDKIPENLVLLMEPHCKKVDLMLGPGIVLLRWTSLNLTHFADSVTAAINTLDLLVGRAGDILAIQIEEVLDDINSTLLCDLPGNDPWTMEEFVSRIKVFTSP